MPQLHQPGHIAEEVYMFMGANAEAGLNTMFLHLSLLDDFPQWG
jgi:hypothetical protein